MAERSSTNDNVVAQLSAFRKNLSERGSMGSGGEPPDDMERRVAALERGQELIIGKLDGIANDIRDQRLEIKDFRNENEKRFGGIEGRLTGIEKTLDAKAAKSDLAPLQEKLGTIDGTVKGLPGISSMITLVISTVALSLGGAAALAYTLAKYLRP